MLAVDDRDPHVLQRIAGEQALGRSLADALLDGGDVLPRNHPSLDRVLEFESAAARQRFDLEGHFAELAGAAALFLVAVARLGGDGDRLPVGNGGRTAVEVQVPSTLQLFEHQLEMNLAETAHHGFLAHHVEIDLQAGVLVAEAVKRLGELLFIPVLLRREGKAEDRLRVGRRGQVDEVLLVGVVQHRISVNLLDPGNRADVAGHALGDFALVLALQPKEVGHLEGLAAVADEQLGVRRDPALVDAEDAQLAAEGVVADLKDMGDRMRAWIGAQAHRRGRRTLSPEKLGRIAFGGVGHEPTEHIQQLGQARAAAGRDEANGDEMAFTQGLLEWVVQLIGIERLALLEIERHQRFVDLDHLIDDVLVRLGDRGDRGLCRMVGLEETVDDAGAIMRRQVDRQAFGAECLDDPVHKGTEIHGVAVDLVDHDHAAFAGRRIHCPAGDRFDAGLRVDDHHGRVHRGQDGQCATEEIGRSRCVDKVQPVPGPLQVSDAGVDRMPHLLFERVEIADGIAFLDTPGSVDRAARCEQGFEQLGLAGAGLAEQRQVANVVNRSGYHEHLPV